MNIEMREMSDEEHEGHLKLQNQSLEESPTSSCEELTSNGTKAAKKDNEKAIKPILVNNSDFSDPREPEPKAVRFMLNPKDLERLDDHFPIITAVAKKKEEKRKKKKKLFKNANHELLTTVKKILLCLVMACNLFFGLIAYKNIYRSPPEEKLSYRNQEIQSLQDLLPGITLCTSNSIEMSRLQKHAPDIKYSLEIISHLNISQEIRSVHRKKLIQGHVENFRESGYIKDFEAFSPDGDDFIGEFFCNLKWIKKADRESVFTCSNLIRFKYVERSRVCFNLFHRKSIIAGKKGIFDFESKFSDRDSIYFMLGVPRKEKSFDSNQLLEFTLDFDEDDFAPHEKMGGEVMINSNRFIPSGSGTAYPIRPGKIYYFHLQKQTLIKNVDCFNYVQDYNQKAQVKEDFSVDMKTPVSRESCIDACISKSVMEKCRCWSPSVPFINYTLGHHSPQNYHHNNLFWCGSILNAVCEYSGIRRICTKSCPADCLTEKYTIEVNSIISPEKHVLDGIKKSINLTTGEDDRKKLQEKLLSLEEFQANKAIIKIYLKPEMTEIFSGIREKEDLSLIISFTLLILFNLLLAFLLLCESRRSSTKKQKVKPDDDDVPQPFVAS